MSTKPNHRRGHGRIQGNGPRWEGPNPEDGCNSTHVARARTKWKKMDRRHLRRTGQSAYRFRKVVLPEIEDDDGLHEDMPDLYWDMYLAEKD